MKFFERACKFVSLFGYYNTFWYAYVCACQFKGVYIVLCAVYVRVWGSVICCVGIDYLICGVWG